MIRIILAASMIACGVAQPAEAGSQRSQPIKIADLDLSSKAGQAQLDRRIKRAALSVCGAKIVGDKVGNAVIEACRVEAVARARREAEIMIASSMRGNRLAVRSR